MTEHSAHNQASESGQSGSRPLRFGLVGTGYWARVAHARALAGTPGIEFTSVWGRNPAAARALASEFGVTAHADFDEFLAGVDGVEFAVPPDVQAELAVRAARAGRHLLLEKPLALTEAAGEELGKVEAADAGELVELGAAGEAVGQHHGARRGVAHGGQQGGLRHGHRDLVVAAFDPEVAGQPAAAADRVDLRAGPG